MTIRYYYLRYPNATNAEESYDRLENDLTDTAPPDSPIKLDMEVTPSDDENPCIRDNSSMMLVKLVKGKR